MITDRCLGSRSPATIFIHTEVSWDQMQLMISKSTTTDLIKMAAKLEEFFLQQFQSSRRVLIGLGESGRSGGGQTASVRRRPPKQPRLAQSECQTTRHLVGGRALSQGLTRFPPVRCKCMWSAVKP